MHTFYLTKYISKHLRSLFHSAWQLILLIAFLLVTVGYNIEAPATSLEPIQAALIDLDKNEFTNSIIADLQKQDLLALKIYDDEAELPALTNKLETGSIEAIYVLNKGFEEKLLAGNPEGAIELYYGSSPVAAKLLTETVSATVMNRLIETRGRLIILDTFQNQNTDVPTDFNEQVEKYSAYIIENGAEFPLDVKLWDSSGADKVPAFSEIMKYLITVFFLMLITYGSSISFSAEKESGVFLRLNSCGHSAYNYTAIGLIVNTSIWTLLSSILCSIVGSWQMPILLFPFLICFSLLAACLLVALSRSSYLLIMPVISLLIVLIGGSGVYFGESSLVWRIIGVLNPLSNLLLVPYRLVSILTYLAILVIAGVIFILTGKRYETKTL